MASASTKAATTKLILKPVTTLKGHGSNIMSMSYSPDGQRIISGSADKTARQWDLKVGKEIEEARDICGGTVYAVGVSRDGRWVVTGGRNDDRAELKAREVETGIVKTFEGHSLTIYCIDISTDGTLLASGSGDGTARIWNLDTGKLVAGPFGGVGLVGAVRLSTDSKKLAVKLDWGTCLEVWDVQSQKLDVRIGKPRESSQSVMLTPVFWTNNNRNLIAAFNFTKDSDDHLYSEFNTNMIYEFDASTLETVGAPFEGHTNTISRLAFSFDCNFLASTSNDATIKFWVVKSRQLLASFDLQNFSGTLILSPDSRQLVYTSSTEDGDNICICDTPPNILARARTSARKKSTLNGLLNSNATRRPPTGHRRPLIPAIPMLQRAPPTIQSQQPTFLRLRNFFRLTPRTNAVPPVCRVRPCDPLDFPATLPLPPSLSGQTATRFDHFEISSPPPPSNGVTNFLREHLSFRMTGHSHGPPVVEVAAGRKFPRLVAANLPDYRKVDDTRRPSSQQATVPQENESSDNDSLPDVHWCKAFLCYYSCLSHGRLRMPPRWRLERVDRAPQDGTANNSPGGVRGRT